MHWRRSLILLICVVGATVLLLGQAKRSDPRVEILRLKICKRLPDTAKKEGRTLRPCYVPTEILLLVSEPERRMVDVQRENCRLNAFVDDKGDDMSEGGGFHIVGAEFTDDGHYAIIPLRSTKIPSPGATRIIAEGTLAITTVSGEKTEERISVPLVKETKISVGRGDLIITSVKAEAGEGRQEITFRYDQPDYLIKHLRLFEESGKEIEAEKTSPGFGFGGDDSFTKNWLLPRGLEKVTLKVTYYSRVDSIEIPLDVSVGVGL